MKNIFTTLFTISLACFGLSACDVKENTSLRNGEAQSLLPVCQEGDRSCTYTMGWYKNHTEPGDWPLDPQTEICGQTLFDILWTQPSGDHWLVLSHQWITATLNVLAGAPVDAVTWQALVDAEPIVMSCSVEDKDQASELTEILDAFNNGLALAPHCDALEGSETETE